MTLRDQLLEDCKQSRADINAVMHKIARATWSSWYPPTAPHRRARRGAYQGLILRAPNSFTDTGAYSDPPSAYPLHRAT